MRFSALVNEAWVSIGTNRLRAFLAMLGIVIGIGSVVLMMAIGAGSQRAVEEGIAKLGSNLLIVAPGSSVAGGLRSGDISKFDLKDVAAIGQLPSVLAAAAATYPRPFQAASGKLNWNTQVTGVTPDFFDIRNWVFAEGGPFTSDDLQQNNPVAVLGATAAGKLFTDEMGQGITLVGRSIHINGTPFRIAGALQAKGQGFDGRDQDDAVFIPITTAKNRLWGKNFYSSMVQMIFVKATSGETMDEASEEISALLRQRHNVGETKGDNFTIHNLTSIMQVATETTQAFSLLLGAIASISLVVGGIGIMNIMLVTVTERTREIGIRKAIGATEHQILLQFLFEATLIACMGSLVGLIVGFGGGLIVEAWLGISVEYGLWSIVLALGVAASIGVASGIYPAYKAARLQPIEALRTVGG
jgi:putative ABC transport system permease protein